MAILDNRVATTLRTGGQVCGVSIGTPHPALLHMCGLAGYDFAVIDNEHGPASVETTGELIRTAWGAGIAPIVRTHEADIGRLLDAGAGGIQVPLVETAEQAARIVAACRYPPVGTRSVAFSTLASGYGFFGGLGHAERSNDAIAVVLMIETSRGVANLDEILAVPGIDAISLGATDMSYSMGVPGQGNHPKVRDAIADCARKCAARGIATGGSAMSLDDLAASVALGMRYHTTMLTFMITHALKGTLADMRRLTGAAPGH